MKENDKEMQRRISKRLFFYYIFFCILFTVYISHTHIKNPDIKLKNKEIMKKIIKSHQRIDYFEKNKKIFKSKGNKTPTTICILDGFLFGFTNRKKAPILFIHPSSQRDVRNS